LFQNLYAITSINGFLTSLKYDIFFSTGGQGGNPENGETPSASGAGVPGSAASRRLKSFPEESLPDLIRLVSIQFPRIGCKYNYRMGKTGTR
jgi:hypothetical protein